MIYAVLGPYCKEVGGGINEFGWLVGEWDTDSL